MKKLTVGSLYAGIGGIEKAFINSGFRVLWANENDKNACITYRMNFRHNLFEEDIYNLNPESLEKTDIITAGFPCQPFSVAGYRKGFRDERGNHFFKIMEIANAIEPKVLFLENVKNFMGHDHGRTWSIVHDSIINSGYSIQKKIMNTMEYSSLPQNRERFYAVCFKNEADGTNKYSQFFSFPDKTDHRYHIKELIDHNVADKRYFYGKEKYMYRELKKGIRKEDTIYQWRRMYVRENKNNVCPTLTANMGTGGHNVPIIKLGNSFRKLTPAECFKFQGFDDIILPDIAVSQLYKQAGNSVSVPVIEKIAMNILKALKEGDKSEKKRKKELTNLKPAV